MNLIYLSHAKNQVRFEEKTEKNVRCAVAGNETGGVFPRSRVVRSRAGGIPSEVEALRGAEAYGGACMLDRGGIVC